MWGSCLEAVRPLAHMGGNHEFYALLGHPGSRRYRFASCIRHRQHKLLLPLSPSAIGDTTGVAQERRILFDQCCAAHQRWR